MKEVRWHPEAMADLEAILRYCKQEFGSAVARKIRDKILHAVGLLKLHPSLGAVESLLTGCTSLEYRSLQAGAYTKIVYSVHEDYVYIHLLWDTRQDAGRLKQTVGCRYRFPEEEQTYQVNEPLTDYDG